jgi:hypothetical protein
MVRFALLSRGISRATYRRALGVVRGGDAQSLRRRSSADSFGVTTEKEFVPAHDGALLM